jgi:urease gamma subunit
MFERLNIEDSILGAIIYHNGYPQIAHILSPANFSDLPERQNRGLYSIICGLFPDRPIDLVSISHEIRTKHPHNVALMSTLLNTGHRVCSATSIVHWASILLEIDITGKFQRQIADWRSERESNLDHVEAAALLEIFENATAGRDIFDLIDEATRYFHHHDMQTELDGCIKLHAYLSKKFHNIKKMNSINTALNYLLQISSASPEIAQVSHTLVTAIADMIISEHIKQEYIQAANLINK